MYVALIGGMDRLEKGCGVCTVRDCLSCLKNMKGGAKNA